MNCTKCGHEHDPKHCSGHVIKDPTTREPIAPRQCGKTPVKGSTVCRSHGAAKGTPAAAAAEVRQADAAADAVVRDLWPGLATAEALTDPIALLGRTATVLEQMADVVGARVNELKHVGSGKDLTQMRAEVVLLDRLLDKVLKAGDALARLGLAERQVELEAAKAQIVVTAFLAALNVGDLLPVQRDDMLKSFLTGLGRGPEIIGPDDDDPGTAGVPALTGPPKTPPSPASAAVEVDQ